MFCEFVLSIGLNDKDTRKQEIATTAAVQIVKDAVGDSTIQLCEGRYTHNDGTQVDEVSLRVFIYDDLENIQRIKDACQYLKRALNQECIVLARREVAETEFI